MRFHGSILRTLILATIKGARSYYEVGEAQFATAKEADLERIREEINALGLDAESSYNEWCLERQSHSATHEMLMPNFFRYSFLVLLYLIIENKLKELCEAAKYEKALTSTVSADRSTTVFAYEKYLTYEAGISGINWNEVYNLNKIRNCIVHNSGCVQGWRDELELRSIASRGTGISISGYGYTWSDDILPLYLEDHMLVIEPQYCLQITADVEQLFTAICDAIPLKEFNISLLKEKVSNNKINLDG